MLILQDVGVYDQRLAGSRGAPESELVELRQDIPSRIEQGHLVRVRLVLVVPLDLLVYRGEQCGRIVEVAVEIYFREQQRQVLKILPDNRALAARQSPLVQALRVPDDILIVFQKQVVRQRLQLFGLVDQRRMETMDIVLVETVCR